MAGKRFTSWSAMVSGEPKPIEGELSRSGSIVDIIHSAVNRLGPAKESVVRITFTDNHGKSDIANNTEFMQLISRHLTPTQSMRDAIAQAEIRRREEQHRTSKREAVV